LLGFVLSAAALPAPAQEQAQPQSLDRTLTSLHGVVRNAATGEGLPRALVRVEGDAATGALTDGEGRFEIPNIPVGPEQISVVKPGFFDFSNSRVDAADTQFLSAQPNGGHNVMVAAQMPDVVFTLSPAGAIRGQVELSTGDSAAGITLSLAHRAIAQGRAVWQSLAVTKARSDGSFRFGGLADGDYALYSAPSLDNDLDGSATPPAGGQHWGFAASYYPDARDPSSISAIRIANGQEAQANLTLALEPWQLVKAVVSFPQGAAPAMDLSTAVVADNAGRQLPYLAQYDPDGHSIHAELPDGNYTLFAANDRTVDNNGPIAHKGAILAGSVDFAVAGRPVPNLSIPLSAGKPSPVEVTVMHNTTQPAGSGPLAMVTVSPAQGWIDDSMVAEYAHGSAPGPLAATYTRPGSYWVSMHVQQKGLCESSLTAGGADLAREPLVMGAFGSSVPMALTLRDDCASLALNLPDTQASITAGDEQYYTAYVVPDFDSTSEISPVTLRPSTGGGGTVVNLTPGNYHVYTFPGFVEFAYRNPEALKAMSSRAQAVTLSPTATASLQVEVPTP
jgi:hypothetical protein